VRHSDPFLLWESDLRDERHFPGVDHYTIRRWRTQDGVKVLEFAGAEPSKCPRTVHEFPWTLRGLDTKDSQDSSFVVDTLETQGVLWN